MYTTDDHAASSFLRVRYSWLAVSTYSKEECAIRHINPGFLHSPSNKAFGETARSKHTLSYWDAKVIVQILPPCQSVSVTSHKKAFPSDSNCAADGLRTIQMREDDTWHIHTDNTIKVAMIPIVMKKPWARGVTQNIHTRESKFLIRKSIEE